MADISYPIYKFIDINKLCNYPVDTDKRSAIRQKVCHQSYLLYYSRSEFVVKIKFLSLCILAGVLFVSQVN
ncbi:hypothetical protein BU393_20530, partial [Salmonella enterica]|nr:hypothetical protein [Salmonella enterica]